MENKINTDLDTEEAIETDNQAVPSRSAGQIFAQFAQNFDRSNLWATLSPSLRVIKSSLSRRNFLKGAGTGALLFGSGLLSSARTVSGQELKEQEISTDKMTLLFDINYSDIDLKKIYTNPEEIRGILTGVLNLPAVSDEEIDILLPIIQGKIGEFFAAQHAELMVGEFRETVGEVNLQIK